VAVEGSKQEVRGFADFGHCATCQCPQPNKRCCAWVDGTQKGRRGGGGKEQKGERGDAQDASAVDAWLVIMSLDKVPA
jgi:hypothetical protein